MVLRRPENPALCVFELVTTLAQVYITLEQILVTYAGILKTLGTGKSSRPYTVLIKPEASRQIYREWRRLIPWIMENNATEGAGKPLKY
jgi:hypothetical protein